MPSVLLSSLQSFGRSVKNDKTTDLETTLNLNNVDIACITETMLSDNLINYISFNDYTSFHSVRQDTMRASGGVSIFVKNHLLPVKRLNCGAPNIEDLWLSVRPKWLPRKISVLIVACIYYPGSGSDYAPSQEELFLHISENIHKLSQDYTNPLFIITGDFNNFSVEELCDSCKLNQVVKVPTRKDNILDLILTNTSNKFYKAPYSLPAIGKSDHFCVMYEPLDDLKFKTTKETKLIRIFKESALIQFGAWLTRFNWSLLCRIDDVNLKVAYFFTIMWAMIDIFFPLTKVVVTNNEKEWITPEIKLLISDRQNAHLSKNVDLCKHLSKKVAKEIKKAKINYNTRKTEAFSSSNSKEWYQHIFKIIGSGNRNLVLHNIPDLSQKSMDETVSIINNQFATICRTYPSYHGQIFSNREEKNMKFISEVETWKLLKLFTKKALGPNDFPKQILVEFAVELALPFCNIANCALQTGVFPHAFKISEIIPIPKQNPPQALKDLRPISKTPVGGKIIEKMILSELQEDTKNTLNDPTQYGNTKGSSTTHYLIKLTDEAYKNTDKGKATTAITIDYSKAFDLVDHSTLINKLSELGVRNNLINLVLSFLSDRKHYTNANGVKSELVSITCGVPQGTLMGPWFFTVLVNGVICSKVLNFKFVDDKTLAHSYVGDATKFLQDALNEEAAGTVRDKMVINDTKCNIITFNFSRKNTKPQNLLLNGNPIKSVEKISLLGVIITSDLKWKVNTDEICKQVNRKLFILVILKRFGVKVEKLISIWKVVLRSRTEYAAPLWHSGLTDSDSRNLERLQKSALGIILGVTYVDFKKHYKVRGRVVPYEEALALLKLPTLSARRETLTRKFAEDTFNNERHKGFFEESNDTGHDTRLKQPIKVPFCKTDRYRNSAIPYMSRLLNEIAAR